MLAPKPHEPAEGKPSAATHNPGIDLTQPAGVRYALQAVHDEWAGTPYRYGGLSLNGVDCSGLVYRVFREYFGLDMPRTTRGQVRIGHAVTRNQLRAGDLVFFKTGRRSRHVGIYIGDHRFLNASTSEGVEIADLRNPYWAGHWWQARRVRATPALELSQDTPNGS